MTTIKVAYLKLNLNGYIIDCNNDFAKLFNITLKSLKLRPISILLRNYTCQDLKDIGKDELSSFIIFCNINMNKTKKQDSMIILYAVVTREEQYYSIKIVNWLNWIHYITNSLEHAYEAMYNFNNITNKTKFKQISDVYCYKALYPLITYIPHKYSNSVSQSSLFEIMRVFFKQREDNKYSKDYARNVYSRIRTSLKQELNMDSFDAIDVIKNHRLLRIKYNGNIFIPNTLLVEDIVLPVKHDLFLLSIIEAIHPN